MNDGEGFNFRENTKYDASLICYNNCLPLSAPETVQCRLRHCFVAEANGGDIPTMSVNDLT